MGYPTDPVANGLRLAPAAVFASVHPSLIPAIIWASFYSQSEEITIGSDSLNTKVIAVEICHRP